MTHRAKLLLLITPFPLAACSMMPFGEEQLPDTGVDPMGAALMARDSGDFEAAAEIAGDLAEDKQASVKERAEAAFVAAEAEMQLGEHLAAFRHYRYILESAPWSTHTSVIEDRLLEIGEAFFHDEKYEGWIFSDRSRGVDALETLQAHYSRSDRADDALKLVGDYYSDPERAEWDFASLTFERLLEEYPESEWAEYALWMAGHCRLEACAGSPYDRDDLLRARAMLESSLERHPKGMSARRAREDLDLVNEELAKSELFVADFYKSRGVLEGEQMRLVNAAVLYPRTEAGRLADLRLQEMGLDPAVLARDVRRNSIDAVRPGVRRFDSRRNVFGFGF